MSDIGVIGINTRNKDGRQPHYQDRIYDTEGICTALTAFSPPLIFVEMEAKGYGEYAENRSNWNARHQGHGHHSQGLRPRGNFTHTKYLRGGYREVKILDLSKFRVRKLTPTEYGRLQAFPMERWEQVVSDSQAYKQFGNAVTVSVVTAIADRLRTCIETIEEITKEQPKEPQETIVEPLKPLEAYTNAELLEELMRRQTVKG